MIGVDEHWIGRRRRFDPFARGIRFVECDTDDGESVSLEFFV
jgi:hypothetical protein